MNAELARNVWHEITPVRLAAMPAVLGVIFAATWLAQGRDELASIAWWLGHGIGLIWGARLAAGAVMAEIAGRTWDSQRASALTPWQMTWGKLLGATLYAWYGVAICLLVHLGAGGDSVDAATMLLRCLLGQATALFASLVLLGLGGRSLVMTSLPHLAGILAGAGGETVLALAVDGQGWFGFARAGDRFALLSLLLFWGWAVLGTWRLMGRELTVAQRPWAWPCFVLFLAAYAAGFGWGLGGAGGIRAAFIATALAVASAALCEPKSRVTILRLLDGDLGATPPSLQALAITAVLAIVLGAQVMDAPVGFELTTTVLPFALVLFLLRDIALIRLVSLRSTGPRGALAAIVWLCVLYAALPALLGAAGADVAIVLLLPIPAEGFSLGTLAAFAAPGLQALVLWMWLARAVRAGAAGQLTPPRLMDAPLMR